MTDSSRDHSESAPAQCEAPTERRRRKGLVARVVLYPLILYTTYCVVLYFAQNGLIFPAGMAPPPLKFPPISSTLEWERTRDDGSKGVAWFIPAPGASADNPRPVTIFFHGNAEIIDHQVPLIEGYLRIGCAVLLPEYPGYGRAEGAPGQRAIMDDAEYFMSELLKRSDVDAARIYYHGRSIGGGPAAQLALRREPAALILESTFTSMASFADGYFAPRFLVRHPFRTDSVLESLRAPVLIMHGTRDTLVPFDHACRLRDLATQSTHVGFVEYDCGHIDFPGSQNEDDCWRRIETFLKDHAGHAASRNRAGKSQNKCRLAVLISGSGTTLQNLIDRIADGRLPHTEIAIVISSRTAVEGVNRAERAQLPCEVIRVMDNPDVERFSDQISLTLDIYAVNLVVQAGWLCHWIPPGRWANKTINIHPSLLPKFGGKGFYGHRVHEAVLAAGETESGATVHWVNDEYDAGKIIEQRKCEVKPDDTIDSLAERVQAIERELLPEVIDKIRKREIKFKS